MCWVWNSWNPQLSSPTFIICYRLKDLHVPEVSRLHYSIRFSFASFLLLRLWIDESEHNRAQHHFGWLTLGWRVCMIAAESHATYFDLWLKWVASHGMRLQVYRKSTGSKPCTYKIHMAKRWAKSSKKEIFLGMWEYRTYLFLKPLLETDISGLLAAVFYLRGVGTDSISPSFPSPRGKLLSLDLRKPCRLNSSAFCHLSCHGFSYAVAIRHTSLKHLIQGAGLGTESPRSNPGFEARVGPQHFGWLSSPLTLVTYHDDRLIMTVWLLSFSSWSFLLSYVFSKTLNWLMTFNFTCGVTRSRCIKL